MAYSQPELFKLDNPQRFTLPSLAFPMETPIKYLAQAFPSLLCSAPLPKPGTSPVALCGV